MKKVKDKFQRKQIDAAKSQMNESIYAHIVGLIEESDLDEVFTVLSVAAKDMEQEKRFKKLCKKARKWN